MMKSRLFSSESRLSDLITAHPSLLTLLNRLGISLGFGDRSIADVCEQSGVDTGFFLLICNVYTFNNYVPSTAAILGTDMMGLVPYLEKSHRYYVDKRLPHIERHLDAIARKLSGRIGQVFISFFKEYKQNEITLVMDGESYHWDRESVSYDYGNLKHFNLEGHDAKLYVGDSEYEHFELYQRTEQPSVLYFEVTSSGSGEYLPLYLDIPD